MPEFVVVLDTSKLDRRVDGMLKKLAEFPPKMAQELTDWQVQDMHRKYPNTTLDENVATTGIWPRSRGLGATIQRLTFRARRAIRRQMHHTFRPIKSEVARARGFRPILRPALFEKLCERMAALMQKELNWKL